MTLKTYTPRAEMALQTAQDVAVTRLGEWARSAEAAHHIASTLVQTSFCPESFRNKPGEATAAILAGLEVGLQPMAALRSFDVIQGQAAPRAITLRAIVQSHGHEMVMEESTATRCKMKGRRRGTTEWTPVTWTIDRAKQLGVTNKPNWRNQPQAMLVARATSELARLIASDAILGIGYTVEEIDDGGTMEMPQPVADAPAAGTRRMSRPQRDAEPEPDPQPEDEAAPQESPLLNTSSKLAKAMYAGINEAQIGEDERLPYISGVIGHDIGSTKEMTEDEARAVLADLDQRNTADPSASDDPWAAQPALEDAQ